jgi:hypothetical protein
VGGGAPDVRPTPAQPDDPPVLIESVSRLRGNLAGHDFVLPQAPGFGSAELREFNKEIFPDSGKFNDWYSAGEASASESGLVTLTIRGNWDERVRISDIVVHKKCGPPLTGGYFAGYSQGSGDTIRVGINLDDPSPVPEEMAQTAQGLTPTGDDFFAVNTVELEPGKLETLTVGVFTKLYACSFSLDLLTATSKGTFTQDVNDLGRSFRVTARAPTKVAGHPFSGYESAYVRSPQDPRGLGPPIWRGVDPKSYTGE